MFGIKEFSVNFLTGQIFITALLFILLVMFTLWVYRRTNPPLSTPWKVFLSGLRIVALLALFLALFEPVVSYVREFSQKPKLTIFTDRSASMDISENEGTRLENADRFLGSEAFVNFTENFEAEYLSFSNITSKNASLLDRQKTSIGNVLKSRAEMEIGDRADNWLIVSDGISNDGIDPLSLIGELKSPIFAIGVGADSEEKDIALNRIDYNKIVYAGKLTSVKAAISWRGMNGETSAVEIVSGSKVLGSKPVRLGPGDLQNEVEVSFVPDRTGQQTFEIKINSFEDEVSENNNHRSFSMTVLKSKMNVLLVSDRLDWELAFLSRFLNKSDGVNLTSVIFNRRGGFLKGIMPTRQEDLNRYDMVILYDVDLNKTKARKDIFDSYLNDKGGGILFFMGENYYKKPFPRWIDKHLPFAAVNPRLKTLNFKYNGQPVENYLFHPAVRISEGRAGIREAWSNMPHFEALAMIDSIMPNSDILANANLGDSKANQPIIGIKHNGRGRVLAVAAMPFWHWAFYGYGFGDDNRQYSLLFDGLINWLSVREDSDPIQIVPDKNIFTRGEKVGFTAYLFDLGYRPILGAGGMISLTDKNGNKSDSLVAQLIEESDGKYRAEFESIPSGSYDYFGAIEKDGRRLKEQSGEISIESYSIEEFKRRPEFDNLTSLASLTGGKFFRINEADSIFTYLNAKESIKTERFEIVVWNKYWLLAIFIIALGLEWFFRKRLQLV